MHVALLWLLTLPAVAPAVGLGPPRFEIDLDLPPEERWREVVEAYRDILPNMLLGMEMQLWTPGLEGEDGEKGIRARLPKLPLEFWLRHHNLRAEYMAELVGIARLADHPDVTLRRLIIFQTMLEPYREEGDVSLLSLVGVLACDANGTVIHGRSIAYDFRFIARGRRMRLAELALDLTFKRGGRPVFSAVGFPGRIGVLSGMVLQGPSPISVTGFPTGTMGDGGRLMTEDNIQIGTASSMQLAVREALAANLGFRGTVEYLYRLPLSFESSFLVAGTGRCEGAYLETLSPTRFLDNPRFREDFWISKSGIQSLDPKLGLWYFVKRGWMDKEMELSGGQILEELGPERLTAESLLVAMQRHPLLSRGSLLAAVDAPALPAQARLLKRV